MDDPEKVPHQMRVPPRSKKPGAARASLLDSHLNQHQATPDPNTTLTPPHPSRRAQPPTRPPAGAEPYTSPIPTGQQPTASLGPGQISLFHQQVIDNHCGGDALWPGNFAGVAEPHHEAPGR
jgi:hypothetical protein